MNLAIVGYGKMGRLIEQLAPEYGFDVKLRLDIDNNANFEGLTEANFRGIDAAVEFSTPGDRAGKYRAAGGARRERGGRHDRMVRSTGPGATHAVEAAGTGLVWSPNFSVGVSIFSQLVAEAARLLARQPEYGAWAWEIHHATKKDAPSGTLLALVETMKKTGYRQTDRRGRQPRRRASRHA